MTRDFAAFFEGVWGHEPFPWQSRLAAQVMDDGWPRVLELPTGSGKTAALDVALWHLAMDGGRHAPRRIVLVVDRRVVVDQVAERAWSLRKALESPRGPAVRGIAKRLRKISGPDAPLLETSVLRGATVRDDAWARYPHVPVLAASTVDQVGSRLFFRGYGVSDGMRPIHAGLLGCDTLLLLDEVHLARPFADVLEQLDRLRSERSEVPRRFGVVELSATPGVVAPGRFELEEADRTNEVLAMRLRASKRAQLLEVSVKARDPEPDKRRAIAEVAAREACALAEEGLGAIAVVVNRVDTARRVWADLDDSSFDRVLLTGRMRPLDQQATVNAIRNRVMAGREHEDDPRPLIVVATQCIEAGADFDFDGLVTECASIDALRQRFGRLDRLGTRSARAVVLIRSDQADGDDDPVYGAALARTWQWLRGPKGRQSFDFGIDAIEPKLKKLGSKITELCATAREAPILMPAYMDQWVQTSQRPHADPDVSLFLHGIPEGEGAAAADIRVVWRADVTEEDLAAATQDSEVLESLVDGIAAVPPGVMEALPVPIWAFRHWLSEEVDDAEDDDMADVDGVIEAAGEADRGVKLAMVWRGRGESSVRPAKDVPPGSLVVVPSSFGGIGSHGTFDPKACSSAEGDSEIVDLGDAVQLLQRGRPTLRLDSRVLASWIRIDVESMLPSSEDADAEISTAVRAVVEEIIGREAPGQPEWLRATFQLLTSRGTRLARIERSDGTVGLIAIGRALAAKQLQLLLREQWTPQVDSASDASTDGDDGSFTGASIALDDHLVGVGDLANRFAVASGLPKPLAAAVRWAGRLHDLGKVDPRFQLWIHRGDEVSASIGGVLAKSALPAQDAAARRRARIRARYPAGQRHELVSLEMAEGSSELRNRIEADGADPDLVFHLVASHHGWCRPLAPAADIDDSDAASIAWKLDGIELAGSTRHRRARIGSGVAARFWRVVKRYGWHELAYLEAILRLADHRRSALEQQGQVP